MGEIRSIDVQGYSCPYPLHITLMEMSKIGQGDRLEILLDNPPSCEDIPIAAGKKGYKVLEVTKLDETLRKIVLEK